MARESKTYWDSSRAGLWVLRSDSTNRFLGCVCEVGGQYHAYDQHHLVGRFDKLEDAKGRLEDGQGNK